MLNLMLKPIGIPENATTIDAFSSVFTNILSYVQATQISILLLILWGTLRPSVLLRDIKIEIPFTFKVTWSDVAKARVNRDERGYLILDLLLNRSLKFHGSEIKISFARDQEETAQKLISKYGKQILEEDFATSAP